MTTISIGMREVTFGVWGSPGSALDRSKDFLKAVETHRAGLPGLGFALEWLDRKMDREDTAHLCVVFPNLVIHVSVSTRDTRFQDMRAGVEALGIPVLVGRLSGGDV